MALQELHFEFRVDDPMEVRKEWTHAGVVASGDLEVLMEKKDLQGSTRVKVITPVRGFDRVWQRVLDRFVRENRLGNVMIEINDNYATPLVASARLRQTLAQARDPEGDG